MKLDTGIIHSTLWMDRECREVFITALLMAEPWEIAEPTVQLCVRSLDETGFVVPAGWYGFVRAAGIGIVRTSMVEIEAGMLALEKLGNPDNESRSKAFDGRRLVRVDGGFIALNYMDYRDRDYTAADRQKRYRIRKKAQAEKRAGTGHDSPHNSPPPTTADRYVVSDVTTTASPRNVTQAEAEAEAEAEVKAKNLSAKRELRGDVVAVASLVDLFDSDPYKTAYAEFRVEAHNPVGFDRMLLAVHEPISGGARFSWPVIGQALLELSGTGGRVSAHGLRAFCRKITEPAPLGRRGGATGDGIDWTLPEPAA